MILKHSIILIVDHSEFQCLKQLRSVFDQPAIFLALPGHYSIKYEVNGPIFHQMLEFLVATVLSYKRMSLEDLFYPLFILIFD